MSKNTIRIWLIIMVINLMINMAMHFCTSCNNTLNYLATAIASFAVGIFIQEYHYGKN